jgi:hypothetical protein
MVVAALMLVGMVGVICVQNDTVKSLGILSVMIAAVLVTGA